MESALAWSILVAPLALFAAAALPAGAGREAARRVGRRGAAAAAVALAVSAAMAAVALRGAVHTPLLGSRGIGVSLYSDGLTAAMVALVSFVGLTVVRYSINYLDGDPAHDRFLRLLCAALACVLLVLVSGNLAAIFVAWIGTSTCLDRLLRFYPERRAAFLAARKKAIFSRISDACLIVAMIFVYHAFSSLDYARVFELSGALRGLAVPAGVQVAAVALVIAALLKSAQFPTHGWLVEVMETPTPVSALLHAGIINAGGFLVLRMAGVVGLSAASLDTLAIAGALTALFGSVVMLTQTSVKVALTYSTIAQMGFMMLECGLAAFPAALLHIIAHSLYKAHAFLSSGSVIDLARASWTPSPGGRPHPARLAISIAAVLAVTVVVSRLGAASLTERPGVFALGAIVLLGLVHLFANGIDERPNVYVVARVTGLAFAVAFVFFGLQYATERLMQGSFPPAQPLRGPLDAAIVVGVVLGFAALTFFQATLARGPSPRWMAAYAHVSNGFYVNTLINRVVLRYSTTTPAPPTIAAMSATKTASAS